VTPHRHRPFPPCHDLTCRRSSIAKAPGGRKNFLADEKAAPTPWISIDRRWSIAINPEWIGAGKGTIVMREDDLHGLCTICGHVGLFARGAERSLRESYACPSCRFTLRWRDQAGVILDEFGRGQALSLTQMVDRGLLRDVSIFEPALRGPFVARLKGLPHYTQSYFRPGVPLGLPAEDGVRNEDLTRLTFDEDTFDLIITSDVMEHLPDIELAFAETLRVLRPGGVHVFTIPNDYPFPDRTEPRVRIVDGAEVALKPARYHNAGDGSKCLVYTDYGADLTDMIRALGGRLAVVRRSIGQEPCYTNATFVMRKIAAAGARRPGGKPAPRQDAIPDATEALPAPAPTTGPALECPICRGTTFEPFNGRERARCSTCRAVERNRLMWMVLDRLGAFAPGQRVLHLAPELGLLRKFVAVSPDGYYPADLSPERYASRIVPIHKLDLCADLAAFPDGRFDLILHSHVLEHVPCDVGRVLREMDRILAPGGVHLLSVPIRGERTVEDLSPGLSDAERLARFGQEDHVRIFGAGDLQALLASVWGPGPHLIEPIRLFARDDLRRAAIPTVAWQGVSGHSLFHYRKGGRPPAEDLALPGAARNTEETAKDSAAAAPAARALRDEAAQVYPQEDAPAESDVIKGLTALRRDNPWPVLPGEGHPPVHLALDANGDGGREIILRQIVERDIRLMVEVGCFLGGSALHWLEAKPDLTLIGVDPWDGNWADYVQGLLTHPTMQRHVEHLSDAEVLRIAGLLRSHGNYAVALNNLGAYRDRFYPVRRFSPEALHYLRRRDIPVEMIYIDAFKHRIDLDTAHALFPDAILCGDDWLWPDETGRFVMQDAVREFAAEHGFEIEDRRQSWVLHRKEP
jgi:SAM-dependent methyltransferase